MATRLFVGCAVLLKVSSHRIHLGLWYFCNADSLNVVVVVVKPETCFTVFIGEQLVLSNSAERGFTSGSWVDCKNVEVFFSSHVVPFKNVLCLLYYYYRL